MRWTTKRWKSQWSFSKEEIEKSWGRVQRFECNEFYIGKWVCIRRKNISITTYRNWVIWIQHQCETIAVSTATKVYFKILTNHSKREKICFHLIPLKPVLFLNASNQLFNLYWQINCIHLTSTNDYGLELISTLLSFEICLMLWEDSCNNYFLILNSFSSLISGVVVWKMFQYLSSSPFHVWRTQKSRHSTTTSRCNETAASSQPNEHPARLQYSEISKSVYSTVSIRGVTVG